MWSRGKWTGRHGGEISILGRYIAQTKRRKWHMRFWGPPKYVIASNRSITGMDEMHVEIRIWYHVFLAGIHTVYAALWKQKWNQQHLPSLKSIMDRGRSLYRILIAQAMLQRFSVVETRERLAMPIADQGNPCYWALYVCLG